MPSPRRFALLAPITLAAAALAAPREGATFTSVGSAGPEGDPLNQTRTASFAGGYVAHRVRLAGTLSEIDAATLANEARIRMTPPVGSSVVLQPFTSGGFVGSIVVPTDAQQYLLPPMTTTAGTWTFRFFESFADAAGGADATWTTVTFTLDDEPAPPLPTATATELETNSTKAGANAFELATGSIIGGVTTGGSTASGALASADYFRLRTAPAAAGIYKHQLSLVTRLPGHGVTIRGLSQSAGVISPASDVTLQTALTQANTNRLSQWYGFGRQEELYYRVTGQTSTTDEYRAVYAATPVVPTDLSAQPFAGGAITISSANASILDTDLWVYDSNLTAIPGFGNDDAVFTQSRLTRDFAPGAYYIAISTFNLANDQASPADDQNRGAGVLDFAHGIVASSASTNADVSFTITDSGGTPRNVPAIKQNAFDVVWIKIAVEGGGGCPADVDDGTRTGTRDQAVTIDDLIFYLILFEDGDVRGDLDDGTRTGTRDGAVTIDDLIFFLIHFEEGC